MSTCPHTNSDKREVGERQKRLPEQAYEHFYSSHMSCCCWVLLYSAILHSHENKSWNYFLNSVQIHWHWTSNLYSHAHMWFTVFRSAITSTLTGWYGISTGTVTRRLQLGSCHADINWLTGSWSVISTGTVTRWLQSGSCHAIINWLTGSWSVISTGTVTRRLQSGSCHAVINWLTGSWSGISTGTVTRRLQSGSCHAVINWQLLSGSDAQGK